MRSVILGLMLFFMVGPVIAGKHPVEFVHDIVTSPGDFLSGDPNDGIAVPTAAPTTWRKRDRAAHNFRFYEDFTAKRVKADGLAPRCGKIQPIPGAKAYVLDLAEGSTRLRGEHWEGIPTNWSVVKVTVSPGDHSKLLYLRATNNIIWNIEGRPAAVFMYGPSHLGAAEAGVPVYAANHAPDCKTSGGLPQEVHKRKGEMYAQMMTDDRIANASADGRSDVRRNSVERQLASGQMMMADLNKQAEIIDRLLVSTTSNAPIAKLQIQLRAKQVDF